MNIQFSMRVKFWDRIKLMWRGHLFISVTCRQKRVQRIEAAVIGKPEKGTQ